MKRKTGKVNRKGIGKKRKYESFKERKKENRKKEVHEYSKFIFTYKERKKERCAGISLKNKRKPDP